MSGARPPVRHDSPAQAGARNRQAAGRIGPGDGGPLEPEA
jgi:hypothetical protein